MMRPSLLALALASGWVLAACGGDVEPAGTGGGGGGAASSSGATPAGSTTSATGGGNDTSGSTTSSGGPTCEDFLSPPDTAEPVEVRLVNGTSANLFLGDPIESCVATHFFTLSDDGGDPPAQLDPYLDHCEFTCEMLQTGGCACTGECVQPTLVKIEPGGEYTVSWPGLVYDAAAMPADCYDEGCGPAASCSLPRAAPDALAQATAATALDCTDDGLCDCEAGPSGSCELDSNASVVGLGGETRVAATVFQGGDVELVLTFEE